MKVTIEISPFEARCFHSLIHKGVIFDNAPVRQEWIDNNPEKRTVMEQLHVLEEVETGRFFLTKFGVSLRKAFGNWQPASDYIFDDWTPLQAADKLALLQES